MARQCSILALSCLWLGWMLTGNPQLLSQEIPYDSLFLKAGSVLVYPGSTMVVQRDTLLLRPDSQLVKVRTGWGLRMVNTYLVRDDRASPRRIRLELPDWQAQEGKIIRQVHVRHADVFGYDFPDTVQRYDNRLIRTGNFVHRNTEDWVIRQHLLLKQGDPLRKSLVEDSERILRSLPYIRHARIIPVPDSNNDQQIDLLVLIQDNWSLLPVLSAYGINTYHLGIREDNLLGLGYSLETIMHLNLDRPNEWEIAAGTYNPLGLYTNYRFWYQNLIRDQLIAGQIERSFLAPGMKYGGGLGYLYRHFQDGLIYPDKQHAIELKHQQADSWLGRSFTLNSPQPLRSNLVVAGRVVQDHFSINDTIALPGFPSSLYQNRILALGSISFLRRQYVQTTYLLGFGRTEDLPVGTRLELTAGFEWGAVINRPYLALRADYSHYDTRGGIDFSLHAGTYFGRHSEMESAVFFIRHQYISPLLHPAGPFRHRIRLGAYLLSSLKRPLNQIYDLSHPRGIRWLSSAAMRGDHAFAIQARYTLFSPWKLLGFRLALNGGADLGYVSYNPASIFEGRPYWSMYLGIDINNESLIFGTISLGLAIRPAPPPGASWLQPYFEGEPQRYFEPLEGRKPGIVDLQSIYGFR